MIAQQDLEGTTEEWAPPVDWARAACRAEGGSLVDLFFSEQLDDIAAALGVTKPFIYTHFRSKTDLLAALCTPTIELSLAAVANAAKGPGTPTDRLHRAVVDFTKVVLQRQANIAIFFREEKHLAPEALALHEKMARDLWASALKGPAAVRFMRAMMEKQNA